LINPKNLEGISAEKVVRYSNHMPVVLNHVECSSFAIDYVELALKRNGIPVFHCGADVLLKFDRVTFSNERPSGVVVMDIITSNFNRFRLPMLKPFTKPAPSHFVFS
jgi:hypothetical protein